jgi:hypothetical protein
MPLTKETEDFIASWKQQVASCVNKDDVNVMFDKFRALLQIYNRLYNEVSNRLGVKQLDQKGATLDVVQYLTADVLVASIESNQETREAELRLKDFIRNHTYHFDLIGGQRDPSDAHDNKILVQMESANRTTRMKGLLLLIYKVRCNLVHGQKHNSPKQLPLMHAVIPILELVVSKTEEKLRV